MMEFIPMIVAFLLLLSLIFGAVALFLKAIRSFKAKKFRRGVVSFLFSFIMGFVLVQLLLVVLIEMEPRKRDACSSHLKQIVLFLKMYANDHQETYPLMFDGLVGPELMRVGDASILVCPASHHKAGSLTNLHEWTDYVYVSGLSESNAASCVVAFCLPENHKGEGAYVAFEGGHVMWYSCKHTPGSNEPTFQELTNTPSLFYGTTNETVLADLKKRTRIIYPKSGRGKGW